MSEIEVHVDGLDAEPVLAGRLRPSYTGARTLAGSSFQYDTGYLAHGRAYAISPELPLVTGRVFTGEDRAMFGAFTDAAPDEWGQKIIQANHARKLQRDPSLPRKLGAFDFLLGVSDHTRMGALRFRPADEPSGWLAEDSGVANMRDLSRVLDVARRYETNEASDDDIAYLSDIATSPGGARPKANVIDRDGHLAIAKLPHSKDGPFDVEAWEALALRTATRSGLNAAQAELVPASAHRSILVSRRFDREADGRRIGYISAATALGVAEHGGRTETYEDLAETISELSSDPAADLRELFGRITLNVLVNNVDDHWRNHGFLRTEDGWRLAPAFDVNPSRIRGVISSTPISAADDPRQRDLRNLMATAGAYGLREADAAAILRAVGDHVAEWRHTAADLGIPDSQVAELASAFDADQLEYAMGASD
ncbi:type II toxin-antitoxin system HipA family toxin [Agromyces marinus]|uniref:Phosphatidylinositol kinase n=1 Tax=Agromyces marinus TaxID=1389020 RepID=A0ABN6YFB6_9MICO|nr:HipA domain-containing protein [Agromyces marinus]UIP57181.1 hypothetical protein DSM26151_00350 [Agromyces marinus]BDZ54735.1 phosphatidylinositol kinase [Agromyces marinus]